MSSSTFVPNYYNILNLDASKSSSEIRAQLRKMMVSLHPDTTNRTPSEEEKQTLTNIGDALKIFSNEETRSQYNTKLDKPVSEIHETKDPAPSAEFFSSPSSSTNFSSSSSSISAPLGLPYTPLPHAEKIKRTLMGEVQIILNYVVFNEIKDFDDYAIALANLVDDSKDSVMHLPILEKYKKIITQLETLLKENKSNKNIILSVIKKNIKLLLHMNETERKDNISLWQLWSNRYKDYNQEKFMDLLKKTKSETESKSRYRTTSPHHILLQQILTESCFKYDSGFLKELLGWGVDPNNIFIYHYNDSFPSTNREVVSLLAYTCMHQMDSLGGLGIDVSRDISLTLIKDGGADLNLLGEEEVIAAFYSENLTLAKLLLTHGIRINWENKTLQKSLNKACERVNIDMIRYLLTHGVKPNISDDQYENTLSVTLGSCFFRGNEQDRRNIVEMLINLGGANPDRAFWDALRYQRSCTLELLFNRGVRLPDYHGFDGRPDFLSNSVLLRCPSIILKLIQLGHRVNLLYVYDESVYSGVYTYHKRSPLTKAICMKELETVKILLTNGADPNLQDPNGTPLHHALRVTNEGNPYDPSTSSSSGPSDIEIAIVNLLLEYNADLNIRNTSGYLPIEIYPNLIYQNIFKKHQAKMFVQSAIVLGQAHYAKRPENNRFAKLHWPIITSICTFFAPTKTAEKSTLVTNIFNTIAKRRTKKL